MKITRKLLIEAMFKLLFVLIVWVGVFLLTDTLCFIQATVGFPCPGCGSTRAVLALIDGNLAEALRWHPLILLSLVFFPYVIVRSVLFTQIAYKVAETFIIISVGIIYITVFVWRMVLLFPHTPPMTIHYGAVAQRIFYFIRLAVAHFNGIS